MDFIESLRVIGRRWLISLIGLVLTVSGGVAAVMLVPTNHQASGQLVLLLPPNASKAEGNVSPFLNLEGGLTFVGSLAIASVTTKQTERDMAAAGFTSDFSIAMTPGAGPVLTVTVEDDDPDRALATRGEVIRRVEVELANLQPSSRVPRHQLITGLPNAVSTVAEPLPGNKLRALAVIGVVGLALTLTVAFLRDRRLRVRAARRAQAPNQSVTGEVADRQEGPSADSSISDSDSPTAPVANALEDGSEVLDATVEPVPANEEPDASMEAGPSGPVASNRIFSHAAAARRKMPQSRHRSRTLTSVREAPEEMPEAEMTEELTSAKRTDG